MLTAPNLFPVPSKHKIITLRFPCGSLFCGLGAVFSTASTWAGDNDVISAGEDWTTDNILGSSTGFRLGEQEGGEFGGVGGRT